MDFLSVVIHLLVGFMLKETSAQCGPNHHPVPELNTTSSRYMNTTLTVLFTSTTMMLLTNRSSVTHPNTTPPAPPQHPEFCSRSPTLRNALFAIFMSTVAVVSVVGNGLTILVILYTRSLRSQVAYHFLVSLAFADIFISLLVMPFRVDVFRHDGSFCHGGTFCKIFGYFDYFLHVVSITHLLIIALDRFIAIYAPYYHGSHVTVNKAKIIILIVWVYSAAWAATGMFKWSDEAMPFVIYEGYQIRECSFFNRYFAVTFASVVYFIPTSVTTFLYMVVLVIAQKQAAAIRRLQPDKSVRKRFRKDFRALKTVFVVFTAYTVCYLPIYSIALISDWNVQLIIDVYCYNKDLYDGIMTTGQSVLPVVNSCLNPFIYVLSSGHFRIAFKDMRYKIFRKPRHGIIYPDETTMYSKRSRANTDVTCTADFNNNSNNDKQRVDNSNA